VPTNVVIEAGFNEALNPATVNATTVQLLQNSIVMSSTATLVGGGAIIKVVPNVALAANTNYTVNLSTGIQGTNGVAMPFAQSVSFMTGAGPDTVVPTIVSVSPPNGASNVGDNAPVGMQFSKPVNPLTINGSTVQVSGGGTTITPDTISFSNNNQIVQLVPHGLLPDNTPMTVTISGVTDVAGNAVAAKTTQFTTGTGPDVVAPVGVNTSPFFRATNVATNAVVQVQVNEPLDPVTVNSSTFLVQDQSTYPPTAVTGSYSLSADGLTASFVPGAAFAANRSYGVSFAYDGYFAAGITDLAGNLLVCGTICNFSFTTGAGPSTSGPQVLGVSPANGLSGVPTNAQVMIQFNGPVDAATLGQVSLSNGSGIVNVTSALTNANQTLTLVPVNPLQTGTTHTVNIAGVQDFSGNPMAAPVTATFSTGAAVDLVGPTVVTANPVANATAVPTNAVVQIEFSKRINPLTVTATTFQVSTQGTPIAGNITISADGQTATFTPASALTPSTSYSVSLTNGITDLEGQVLAYYPGSSFTTGQSTATGPAIAWVNPASAFAGASVTISGSAFGTTQGASTVTFNSLAATPTSWNNNEIVVPVPNGAVSGGITVTVSGAASNSAPFTVLATPSITSLSQNSGAVGTPITITGTNFGTSLDSRQVLFNGAAVTPTADNWTATSVVAAVPSAATTGPVTVVVNGIYSNANFVFTPLNPVINTLVPSAAGPGAVITLQGTGFGATQGTSSVQFNGVTATNIVSWSDTAVKVTVPQNATSGNVTLTLAGITSNGVQFNLEQLSITAISPIAGGAGTSVTIAGTGFGSKQYDSTVSFNGTLAAVTTWNDTQIVAIVSQGTTNGPVIVTVGGLSAQGGPYSVDFTALLTDSLGNQTTYKAAVIGGTWYVTDATGSGCSSCSVRGTTHYEYDSNGDLTSETNALGQTTTLTYDANDNVTSISAGGATTSYTYNSFSEPLTVTDPLGHTITNKYDVKGNLISVIFPPPDASTPASVAQFAYDSKGELIQIADPLANPTTLTYTPAGLIASIKDAQGNITSYQYDTHGNRILVTDPLNNQTSFAYDAGDRLTKITYPDQSSASFGYDYRGRRTSKTNPNGKTITVSYDDADRIVSVTDAAQNSTSYVYDTENNPLTITDANGHSTSFTYDAFGRVIQTALPSSLTEAYSYDAIGNLTSKIDRKGQKIQYVYDALNHLTHIGYPDTTGVDYIYDLAGKLQRINDPSGSYGFAYDNMGRLIGTTTQYAFLPSRTFTNTYAYDAASNPTSLVAPDENRNDYIYDSLNRLSGLSSSWAGAFGFSHDALGRRTRLARPNGVNTSYSYDNVSRLLSVLHQQSGVTIDGVSYGLDSAGHRISRTDLLANITTNYSHDALNQLLQAGQGVTTTENYTYDKVGNRLSALGMSPYSYNMSNELTSTPNATYTYDNNGNTIAMTNSTGTAQYTWDFQNRLTQVALPGTGGTVTFKYDPLGRRIEKNSTSGTIIYLYDGLNIVEEVDQNGNQIARYSHGPGIDEPLAMTRGGATSFYEADGLKSITALTGSSGAVTNTYVYDSFGNLAASTGTVTNPFRFAGREYDSETGLYSQRARYYDPSVGRFLSEDPIHFRGGINFYTYVFNNPVDLIDPLGLKGCVSTPLGLVCWNDGKKPITIQYPKNSPGNFPSGLCPKEELKKYRECLIEMRKEIEIEVRTEHIQISKPSIPILDTPSEDGPGIPGDGADPPENPETDIYLETLSRTLERCTELHPLAVIHPNYGAGESPADPIDTVAPYTWKDRLKDLLPYLPLTGPI